MNKNMMSKNLRRSIARSLGRYIAIMAIIALGAALFVGLLVTRDDLIATGQHYTDKQNMYDLKLLSGCGWSQQEVDRLKNHPLVEDAQGSIVMDALIASTSSEQSSVFQIHSISDTVNQVYLRNGRMPEAANECLLDDNLSNTYKLGATIIVAQENTAPVKEGLLYDSFTVVGFCSTPLYMDISRGNTTLGNGAIQSILHLPEEAFSTSQYSQIDLTLKGDYVNYTDTYDKAMADASIELKPLAEELAKARYNDLTSPAQDAYNKLSSALEEANVKKAALEASISAAPKEQQAQLEAALAALNGELADAKLALAEAQTVLESISSEVYILDRNSNVGYLAVNNNSNIVAGVSRVFPAFFLLVAALICITTMTRMVEEERTQIGVLKALGYSQWAISKKYLFYAGSAAILGCGVGVFVGSILFPNILWSGYGIILTMTKDLKLVFNLPLCLTVVAVYTAVIEWVTWYSCKRTMREVPAELIRPKAPTSGKKIFLERLFFWKHLSFLNKVMLRNIFRYRQRLLMMLVGIGGCTALLVTGFGLGDSIQDVVNIQFSEITSYDISLQFDKGQTEPQRNELKEHYASEDMEFAFVHQSSVELTYDSQTWNVYLLVPADPMEGFLNLHRDDTPVPLPEPGDAVISMGVAEALGITAGDTITVRNSDMKELNVTVTGLFDNHVQNYVIVDPQTVQSQWQQAPGYQVAYVNVSDDMDAAEAAKSLRQNSSILNASVIEENADQVNSMLDGLNLIVATVVVCAALLAVIVVYNLTNINITERIREIATIKVLGFNAKESAAYVFKENLLLSVVGAAVGLPLGKLLLDFVMSQIKIDMVWLPGRVQPISLLWSVVITLAVAVVVDCILYFRLEKINMAEALKSVE